MAKLIVGSQTSLLLPQLQAHTTFTGRALSFPNIRVAAFSSCFNPIVPLALNSSPSLLSHDNFSLHKSITSASLLRASSLDVELPGEEVDLKPDSTGGGGDEGSGEDGNRGGGGGGGGDDDDGGNKGNEGSDEHDDAKKNKGISMSQKITLAYAALVGFGGLMGFLKSGSQKSLAAGGLSSLLLYYVYTELPKRPVFASSVGLGLSAALLVVMGSRFKRSGKVFPAGVVSLASLIMTGGYVHGIMRTH